LDRIILNEPTCGAAICQQAGAPPDCNVCGVIARVKDDKLLGGVVFYNYTREAVFMHIGAWEDHWINRDMLWAAFDYPFNVMEVKRIFGEINEDNEHTLKFNAKFGFRTVARIEGVYPGNRACIIRRLDRDDCRYLNLQPRHIKRTVH
jgi:RimJ/RimL family protein N-acetyltransferase